MKTLLTILFVSIIGISLNAEPVGGKDYLVTKDGKIIISKVHFGFFKVNLKNENGDKLKVNYNEVLSFQKNGDLYEKKPLFNQNRNTGKEVFMKKIAWRNGLSLYCYEEPSAGLGETNRYFIFKDGERFWLEVDSRNSETIRCFFNRSLVQ